jgi:hypothetical protein
VYSSWAFFVANFTEEPMKLQSLVQLHSNRGRRSGAMPFGRESWCLVMDSAFAGAQQRSDVVESQKALPTTASATDAVSIPTNRSHTFSGIQGTCEGSIPSPTAEHQSGAPLLNNDRVVQRRRAGQRSLDKYRPAPSSPLDKSPARSGGTLAPTLFASSELLR